VRHRLKDVPELDIPYLAELARHVIDNVGAAAMSALLAAQARPDGDRAGSWWSGRIGAIGGEPAAVKPVGPEIVIPRGQDGENDWQTE
jgi:hypothetical protein